MTYNASSRKNQNVSALIVGHAHTEALKMNKALDETRQHNVINFNKKWSAARSKECRYLNVGEGVIYSDGILHLKSAPGTNGIREVRCDGKRLICVSLTPFTDEQARQVFRGMTKKEQHNP